MILQAFSIFDTKAKVYSNPFFAQNSSVAKRSFTQLVNDGQNNVSRFPEDFILFRIGTFDDQNGVIGSGEIDNLGSALQFVQEK